MPIRPVRSFEALALGDTRNPSAATPAPTITDVYSPAVQLTEKFQWQSYIGVGGPYQQAILQQDFNEPIVQSTLKRPQVPGYAVGLHPSSQTPVAVRFMGGVAGDSATLILKPGQVLRPVGRPTGANFAFTGIEWGLPFGWLGGGLATLLVFQSPDAEVDWSSDCEIPFHRMSLPILAPGDLTIAGAYNNAPKNWPLRFPWPEATRTVDISQKGRPVIAIARPTRILIGLDTGGTNLTNPGVIRFVMQCSNDFGTDSSDLPQVSLRSIFEDVTFNSNTNVGTSGNLTTPYQVIDYTGFMVREAADGGGVVAVNRDSNAELASRTIHLVRYGKL